MRTDINFGTQVPYLDKPPDSVKTLMNVDTEKPHTNELPDFEQRSQTPEWRYPRSRIDASLPVLKVKQAQWCELCRYLKQKAKAEAAKVRLGFAEQEAQMEREQAEKETSLAVQKSKLKLLKSEREYTEAQAELKVMDEYINDTSSSRQLPEEEISPRTKVERYLRDH